MNLEYIVFFMLLIPFIIINVFLIYSDIKIKKIKNKYLLYLLYLIPYWYIFLIYFWHYSFTTEYLSFTIQLFLTFIISFSLYNYWLWSAWDAKYLLVLSLYFPHIWIIPLIWNISLITILYLFLYYIWFYLINILFFRDKTKSLIKHVYIDNRDKFLWYIWYWEENNTKLTIAIKLWNWLFTFLLFFVIIRLLRIYIFDIYIAGFSSQHLYDFVEQYSSYIFFGFIILFIWMIYSINYLYWKSVQIISKKFKLSQWKVHLIVKTILSIILFAFIIWEYLINSEDILKKLYLIFTLYLILYLIVIILWYSYKITFQLWEQLSINYKELKHWDIIDKNYLMKTYLVSKDFWNSIRKKSDFDNNFKKDIDNLSTLNYFNLIKNPVSDDDVKKIQNIIIKRNLFYKKQKNQENFHEIYSLKILKTFAFAWYIFLWFVFTYFYAEQVFTYIITFSAEYFYKHF